MSIGPEGFRVVKATPDEVAEYRRSHGNRGPVRAARNGRIVRIRRLACLACGQRIWGSGIGVGRHRQMCRGEQ